MFDLDLCSNCTLPTYPEDRKECWHSQCENKYLKIGFGLLNLLCQHKQSPSSVCVLRVCIVAFKILACVIWKPFTGGILNRKLKPENKPEVKLLHSCYCLYFFLPPKFHIYFFLSYFCVSSQWVQCLLPHLLAQTRVPALAFLGDLNLKPNLRISVGCWRKVGKLGSC